MSANLDSNKIDFAGFQKKYEYSGSITEINYLINNNEKINYLLSDGSTLIINNKKMNSNIDNKIIIKKLY